MTQSVSRKTHRANGYFREKFKLPMDDEAFTIVTKAHSIRYKYPDLSGPELIRLVYWGASGTRE